MPLWIGRRIWISCAASALILLVGYVALFVILNRSQKTVALEVFITDSVLKQADETLTITSWNLGYGGLGAESDFVSDGGDHLLPPNKLTVDKNIAGIISTLKTFSSDVLIMQEVAAGSFLTRGGDTLGAVNDELNGRDNAFSADFTIRVAPRHYRPRHGLFSSVNAANAERELVPLPMEPDYIGGIAPRRYHLHVVRLPFARGEWAIVNLHLSAFDDDASIRLKQFRAVLEFAESEFSKGRFVVIGGDWNLELVQPGWPSTTRDEDLFWIHPFPWEELHEGWCVAADDQTPTVRTNERPYLRNENFTTVIDGFVVSLNVELIKVRTTDLDFQFTDHQPVTAEFRAREAKGAVENAVPRVCPRLFDFGRDSKAKRPIPN
jgi:endonuclease/exonuclease/phosphatase family metal-dependent hydrolase